MLCLLSYTVATPSSKFGYQQHFRRQLIYCQFLAEFHDERCAKFSAFHNESALFSTLCTICNITNLQILGLSKFQLDLAPKPTGRLSPLQSAVLGDFVNYAEGSAPRFIPKLCSQLHHRCFRVLTLPVSPLNSGQMSWGGAEIVGFDKIKLNFTFSAIKIGRSDHDLEN